MNKQIAAILTEFGLTAGQCVVTRMGSGHIHDTYLVKHDMEGRPPLILQRMNHLVFKNIPLLMRNMELVTGHVAGKNRVAGRIPEAHGIVLMHTPEGASWVGDEERGFWRMLWYIEEQIAFEIAEDPVIAREGGRAIAEFQLLLNDLDPEQIGDTIPEFHNLRMRMGQFEEALKVAIPGRLQGAAELIEIARDRAAAALELFDLSEQGDIPLRLTHNDTKFNNILFSKERKVTCMIDLDTVMKGYAWFDVGDALRTCASKSPEDEPDVSKIGFELHAFEGFANGYLSVAGSFLTDDETALLHRAPGFFAYMQGLRFLTDYLNNDIYYKTAFAEHNFERARAQFTLMQSMLDQEPQMERIVSNCLLGR